jgi:hypothetical protein
MKYRYCSVYACVSNKTTQIDVLHDALIPAAGDIRDHISGYLVSHCFCNQDV